MKDTSSSSGCKESAKSWDEDLKREAARYPRYMKHEPDSNESSVEMILEEKQ